MVIKMSFKMKNYIPLITFVIPTIIITIILFIIDTPSLTIIIGFIILLVAACLTYYLGIRTVLNEKKES
jgi:hypothetical protein